MSNSLVNMPDFQSEMDFRDLIPRYFAEELAALSPLTIKVRRTDLKKFIQFFQSLYCCYDAKLWYPRDSRLFLDSLKKSGYADTYINRNLASIKAFGYWLWETRLVDHDPVKHLKELHLEPPVPQAIEDKAWHRLQKAADILIAKPRSKAAQDFRNKTLMVVYEASGLRAEELLGLTLKQFVANKFVNVRTKGGCVRAVVSIRIAAADLLREYISHHRMAGSEFIFTNRYGGRLSRNGVAKAFNKVAAFSNAAFSEPGAELKIHPHRFRHTHGKRIYDHTHDPVLTARRLGHSGLKYVSRYATPADSEIDEVIEQV